MAFYKNPEEMFKARSEKYKKAGEAHYAKVKNGEGGEHYGLAKKNYEKANIEQEKAKKAKGKNW